MTIKVKRIEKNKMIHRRVKKYIVIKDCHNAGTINTISQHNQ
jgi:hypothetical protein